MIYSPRKGVSAMTIGESIRHHRKRLGLTQLELAERIGVSVQAISKWETNTGLPDISMAVPLARALGTTTDELLQFGQRRKMLEQQWMETLESTHDDPTKMLEFSLEALKEFPWDWQFSYRAALDGVRVADELQDSQMRYDALCRAAAHAQLAVEMDPENQSSKWIRAEIKKRLKDEYGLCV